MREVMIGIIVSVVATTLISVGGYFMSLIRKENKHRFDKLEHRLNTLSSTDNKNKEGWKPDLRECYRIPTIRVCELVEGTD